MSKQMNTKYAIFDMWKRVYRKLGGKSENRIIKMKICKKKVVNLKEKPGGKKW